MVQQAPGVILYLYGSPDAYQTIICGLLSWKFFNFRPRAQNIGRQQHIASEKWGGRGITCSKERFNEAVYQKCGYSCYLEIQIKRTLLRY